MERPNSIDDFALAATELGQGNFSTVFKARHRASSRACAVKRLDKQQVNKLALRHPSIRHEVMQEKHVGLLLRHESVARLLTTFQDGSALYYVYELVEGTELWELCMAPMCARVLEKPRVPDALPIRSAADITRQMVSALAYLHEQAIVHRDLKPENVMVVTEPVASEVDPGMLMAAAAGEEATCFRVKLIDFATSKDLLTPEHNSRSEFTGTPEYMPPEAVDNRGAGGGVPTDTTTDLWALGCLAYQLLAGVTPFKHRSQYVTLQRVQRHGTDEAGRPCGCGCHLDGLLFPPGFPQAAADFVRALLQRERDRRLGVCGRVTIADRKLGVGSRVAGKIAGCARADDASDLGSGPRGGPGIDTGADASGSGAPVSAPDRSRAPQRGAPKPLPLASATVPPTLPVIDYSLITAHPFLTTRGPPSDAYAATAPASAASPPSSAAAFVSSVCIEDRAELPLSGAPVDCHPHPSQLQLAAHLLTLRRRVHVPACLIRLAAASLHCRISTTDPAAATGPAWASVPEALTVGAARCLRLLAWEHCHAGISRASAPSALEDTGAVHPCRLGQHSPREIIGWNVPPDSGAYASTAERAEHWAAWHCSDAAGSARASEAEWELAFPVPKGSTETPDVNARGWRLMHAAEFACQPHLLRTSGNNSTALAGASAAGALKSSVPAVAGYWLACAAHPAMDVDDVTDATAVVESPAAVRLRAFLAAVAACTPAPRAIILTGCLTQAMAEWQQQRAAGVLSLPPPNWQRMRRQLQALLMCCGSVTMAAGRSASAPSAPSTAPPIILAGVEAMECLDALFPDPAATPAEDAALLAQLRDWCSCAGAWVTGTRLLVLSPDALPASVCAGGATQSTASAADPNPLARMHGQWLTDEAEVNRSAAQHVIAALRLHPADAGLAPASGTRGSVASLVAPARGVQAYLGAELGCRAIMCPASLTDLGPDTAPAGVSASEEGDSLWLAIPSLAQACQPVATDLAATTVAVTACLVGQHEVRSFTPQITVARLPPAEADSAGAGLPLDRGFAALASSRVSAAPPVDMGAQLRRMMEGST